MRIQVGMRIVVKNNRDFHGVVVESSGDHDHGFVDLDDGTKRLFFHSSEIELEENAPHAVEVTTRKSTTIGEPKAVPEKKMGK